MTMTTQSPWQGPDTSRERKPMSPEELDRLRPKVHGAQLPIDEAKKAAYDCGIAGVEQIVRRLIALERTAAEQAQKITALETAVYPQPS